VSQPTPVICVIVPAYQAQTTIARTLRSLLAQDDPRWSAIVVDDGSTDRTSETVRSISDPRIRLIRSENRGVSAARNLGFAMSSEPLVCFLDSDDTLDDEYMRHMIPAALGHPLGASCAYRYLSTDGVEIHRVPAAPSNVLSEDALIRLDPPAIMSLVHNRAVLDAVTARGHLFDPTLNSFEDWDLLRRIALRGEGAWSPVGRVLTSYRCTTGSLSADVRRTLASGCTLLRTHWAGHPELQERIRRHRLRCLAGSILSEEHNTARSIREDLGPLDRADCSVILSAIRWQAMRRLGVREHEIVDYLPMIRVMLERALSGETCLPDLRCMLDSLGQDRWGHALKRAQDAAAEGGRIVLYGLGRNGQQAIERAIANEILCVVSDDDPERGCGRFERIGIEEINPEDAVVVTPEDSGRIVDRLHARGLTKLITVGG
jgi:glycosyltransferase involved in cell wall biosynthesis